MSVFDGDRVGSQERDVTVPTGAGGSPTDVVSGEVEARQAAPWITGEVGDVARPKARLEPCRDLRHLPGEGSLLAGIRNVVGFCRRGEDLFIGKSRRYGPIYRTRLADLRVVCVTDPDHVGDIVRNAGGAWSVALGWWNLFDGLGDTGTIDGPVGLDAAPHREVRRLLQPAFSPAALEGYLDIAGEAFDRELDVWFARGHVRFKPAVRRLLAGVSTRIFIGIDDPGEAERLDRKLAAYWRGPLAVVKSATFGPTFRKARAGRAELYTWLRAQVEPRRNGPPRTDLFSRLCQIDDDGSLDDDGLVRLFLGVMLAAFDTTAAGVASMAHLLAVHSDWQERLRDECREVGADGLHRSDLPELARMDWAWKESLRMFPVAGDVPRVALRDVHLGQHRIPAGTFVLPRLGALHRDPNWWTDPERFDPERFSPRRAEHKRHRAIFLPFGTGAHACIGAALASAEVKVFFHRLLSRGRFSYVKPVEARHQYRPLGQVSGAVELTLVPGDPDRAHR